MVFNLKTLSGKVVSWEACRRCLIGWWWWSLWWWWGWWSLSWLWWWSDHYDHNHDYDYDNHDYDISVIFLWQRCKTWAGGSGRAAIDRMAGEEKDWTCILIIGVILIIIMFPIITISSSIMVIATIDDIQATCGMEDLEGPRMPRPRRWREFVREWGWECILIRFETSSLVLYIWFFCLRMSASVELTLGLLKAWVLSESHWKLGMEHSK